MGDQVMHEVRAAIDRALAAPESYARFREVPQVHRILIRRFPYRIFYVLEPDADLERNEISTLKQVTDWRTKKVLEIGCGNGRLTRRLGAVGCAYRSNRSASTCACC